MLKVLLVEDDVDDCESIRSLVRSVALKAQYPFFTEHAISLDAALRLAQKERYDLFIVDFYLGEGKRGLDLVRELRKLGRPPPVMLISGRESIQMPIEVMSWIARGELTFLPKSDLNLESFSEVMQGLFGRELHLFLAMLT